MVSLELEARLDNLLATAQEETADIDLFAPIAEREECPLCLLPLPIKESDIVFKACCGKSICSGCSYKHMLVSLRNGTLVDHKCAFCLQPTGTGQQRVKRLKKLMKQNNPNAYMQMAGQCRSGEGVLKSDTKSLEMYIRAAELGNAAALGNIGIAYELGDYSVEQNTSKSVEFFEVSAKKDSVQAHRDLADFHGRNGNMDECMKHMEVAASAGDQESMNGLTNAYKDSLMSKEKLTQILRAFQASSNEMKSTDRENAHLFEESRKKGELPPAHLLECISGFK